MLRAFCSIRKRSRSSRYGTSRIRRLTSTPPIFLKTENGACPSTDQSICTRISVMHGVYFKHWLLYANRAVTRAIAVPAAPAAPAAKQPSPAHAGTSSPSSCRICRKGPGVCRQVGQAGHLPGPSLQSGAAGEWTEEADRALAEAVGSVRAQGQRTGQGHSVSAQGGSWADVAALLGYVCFLHLSGLCGAALLSQRSLRA